MALITSADGKSKETLQSRTSPPSQEEAKNVQKRSRASLVHLPFAKAKLDAQDPFWQICPEQNTFAMLAMVINEWELGHRSLQDVKNGWFAEFVTQGYLSDITTATSTTKPPASSAMEVLGTDLAVEPPKHKERAIRIPPIVHVDIQCRDVGAFEHAFLEDVIDAPARVESFHVRRAGGIGTNVRERRNTQPGGKMSWLSTPEDIDDSVLRQPMDVQPEVAVASKIDEPRSKADEIGEEQHPHESQDRLMAMEHEIKTLFKAIKLLQTSIP
ncbi:hypothetical protein HKX48_004421 [Thoreauomyces humboldtii]|nr:hypothetical protein HKX48_004421 [Thoreauomyces humboldtii]